MRKVPCGNRGRGPRFGTPTYVYSRRAIDSALRAYTDALCRPARPRSAMRWKANSNPGRAQSRCAAGCGFDIVSGGELVARDRRRRRSGQKLSFLVSARVRLRLSRRCVPGFLCCNVESTAAGVIEKVAARCSRPADLRARQSGRDPKTHPYIATGLEDNKSVSPTATRWRCISARPACPHIAVSHRLPLGSQIIEVAALLARPNGCSIWSTTRARWYPVAAHRFRRRTGFRYRAEIAAVDRELIAARRLRGRARPRRQNDPVSNQAARSSAMPGAAHARQSAEGDGGEKFEIVDAAMNDLLRPRCIRPGCRYWRWHRVRCQITVPVARYTSPGPICDRARARARARSGARAGDLVAIAAPAPMAVRWRATTTAAARGEVMVDGEQAFSVRRRETVTELFASESTLHEPWIVCAPAVRNLVPQAGLRSHEHEVKLTSRTC